MRTNRLTTLIWLAMLVLGSTGAEAVEFADANLEQVIRETLGQGEEVLTEADLASLTQLEAPNRQIAQLGGVEHLTRLKVLNLSFNQIADLTPLAPLASLEFLDLEGNQVKDVSPLASLARLQFLNLAHNQVEEIVGLVDLASLVEVELRGNPLRVSALDEHIPVLQGRGVEVAFDPSQDTSPGDTLSEPVRSPGDTLSEPVRPAWRWEHLGPAEEREQSLNVYSLAFSPSQPEVMYGATEEGVLRSVDGGENWSSTGLSTQIEGIYVDPEDPSRVYASAFWSPTRSIGEAYRSLDGGGTWETLTAPGYLVAVDPVRSGCLYAMMRTGNDFTLSISHDDGITWQKLETVRPSSVDKYTWVNTQVWTHPADSHQRFVGTTTLPGNSADAPALLLLLRSWDDGDTWLPVALGETMAVVVSDPRDVDSLYGINGRGFWRSEDGGVTWEFQHDIPLEEASALGIHPANPEWLWSRSNGALWQSRDGGTSWDKIFKEGSSKVVFHPQDGAQAFLIGQVYQLFHSRDGGESWPPVASLKKRWRGVSTLAFAADGTLYAATDKSGQEAIYPVLLTRADGGAAWTVHDAVFKEGFARLGGMFMWLYAFPDAAAPGPQNGILYIQDSKDGGFYRSDDLGLTWVRLQEYVSVVGVHPEDPARIYISRYEIRGRYEGDRLEHSTDGGATWEDLGPVREGEAVNGIAFHPRSPDHLLAVTTGGMYQSQDGGRNWAFRAEIPVAYAALWARICFHPEDPEVMYLAIGGELLGSRDGGRTWTLLTEGGGEVLPKIRDVASDPLHPGRVYVATRLGVYRLRWPDSNTAVSEEQEARPVACALGPNYPNPFNATTTIPYQVVDHGRVQVAVYNIAGQPVRELVRRVQGAGSHQIVWDGRDEGGTPVASGVYLCRLQTGRLQEVRKLVLLR